MTRGKVSDNHQGEHSDWGAVHDLVTGYFTWYISNETEPFNISLVNHSKTTIASEQYNNDTSTNKNRFALSFIGKFWCINRLQRDHKDAK